MSTLVYYGNQSLQNRRYSVSSETARGLSPSSFQRTAIARGTGSSPVFQRNAEKTFKIDGIIRESPFVAYSNLQAEVENFATQINKPDQYLRFMPEYETIFDFEEYALLTVALSGDAENVAPFEGGAFVDRQPQEGLWSLKFDITTTLTVDNFAMIEVSKSTPTMITSDAHPKYLDGNFEGWIYLPETTNILYIEMRVGVDSSNYRSKQIRFDYQGKPFNNGWNLLSFGNQFSDNTGTFNFNNILYTAFKVVYRSAQVNMAKVCIDHVYWVDENRLRNYPCYREGDLPISGNHFNNTFSNYTASFINYTGYSIGTHQHFAAYSDPNAVSGFTVQVVTPDSMAVKIEGSMDPIPDIKISINSSTGNTVTAIKLENLTSNNVIKLEKSGGFTIGDEFSWGLSNITPKKNGLVQDFSGKIPSFINGINRIKLILEHNNSVSVNHTTNNAERVTPNGANNSYRAAQSFTATATGRITTLELLVRGDDLPSGYEVSIHTDSAGSPSATVLGTSYIGRLGGGLKELLLSYIPVLGLDVSVTSGSLYWIVVKPKFGEGFFSNVSVKNLFWGYDTAGGYASGSAKFASGDIDPTSWSPLTGDGNFKVTITPNWTHLVNWGIQYKKLNI